LKKIRVLFIIDTLKMGGAERSLLDITTRFNKIEPVFLQLYKGDELKVDFESNNIKVLQLQLNGNYKFSNAVIKITEIIDLLKPDLIHASLVRSSLISRKLKKYTSIPLINSFTSNSYSRNRYEKLSLLRKLKLKYIQYLDRLSSYKVDVFISNSQTIKDNNIRALNINPSKIKVIPRGREVSKFSHDKKSLSNLKKEMQLDNSKIIINVGRLIESKGQMDLIRAFSKVKKNNIVLLIVGEGPYYKNLAAEIKRLNLEKSVFLLGKRNDVPALLNISDLFIFTSYLEGLPGSLIEAMMAKLPIIASDIQENLECLPKNAGVFFPVGDINYLYKLIEKELNQTDAEKLQSNERVALAHNYALKNYDINVISDKYEKLYSELLKSF